MTSSPINIFQRLMRTWEAVHPYNAAQLLEVDGDFDSAAAFENWSSAWDEAMAITGLGRLHAARHRYGFENPTSPNRCPLKRVDTPWRQHVSDGLDRSFDDADAFPFRPFVARGSVGAIVIGVVYRHWVADSVSIRMLLKQWFLGVVDPSKRELKKVELPRQGYWNTVGPGGRDFGIGQSIANAVRRQTRLRRAKKIGSHNLNDYRTAYQQLDAPPGLVPPLKCYAAERGVGLNHVLLAALTEACWQHVPLQARPSRREIAVGSIVDLRPAASRKLSNVFGLYLGFTNVICQPHEVTDFDRLLSVVASQVRNQKLHGIAACSLMWMSAAAVIGRWSTPARLYHFYRKDLPLAGGSSNVDLSQTWAADYWPSPLRRYVRVSPTGPMTPLVVTTTTLGNRLEIGLTHRVGLIDSSRARLLGATFVGRLRQLASLS